MDVDSESFICYEVMNPFASVEQLGCLSAVESSIPHFIFHLF